VNWLGFSLLALGLWGMWGLLSKVATQHLPAQAAYVIGVLGHVVAVSYLVGTGLTIPWHAGGAVAALGAGLCTAFGLVCFFYALALGGAATVVVPLTALYPVVTVVLSRVFLQESLTPRHLAGIGLALAAVWLLSE
jgi:transporter family protein